ncbi:carnitine O-acetyltransferase-like [Coccinella septempunctata]|uniref:carnitine O-acetyltransferase-like n=1 Tax=Coccinella septempunctata TaxID=41139 RepID=UPI001D06EA5B|nr:carnitine O-acetyltransferase-like [Coccinella septempunctata]
MLSKSYIMWNSQRLQTFLNPFSSIQVQQNMLSSKVQFLNKLNLPSLPVPKLHQTLTKYLKSVEPFLTEQELLKTKTVVKKFADSEAPLLQSYLENKASNCENWLSDWWDNTAYLEYRDPVTVFSSPGLVCPLQQFSNEAERLSYASKMILGAINYKQLIDRELLPLDKMGKDPLDMNQYKKIYGTCRIPRPIRDELQFNPNSKHIIIARNNNFFKMDVITPENGVPSFNQILSQLIYITKSSEVSGSPIGILTSDNRDNWCNAYKLLSSDKTNRESLDAIESSLFILCLDNPLPKWNDDTLTLAAKQCIHGGGLDGNSANRWFDKTLQFIVGTDGIVGLTYEHSPSEGQPVAVLTDHVVKYIEGNDWKSLPDIKTEKYPEPLIFNVDQELIKAMDTAATNVNRLADNLELNVFNFKSFGKEFVKSQKLSPDSFIQIAIQYAFYRIHKVPGAHYESAATRRYIHGRTETIRSCSTESVAFAKEMLDNNSSEVDKLTALKTAIMAHKNYTIDAINGFGVDRHLLGLKLAAKELKKELPELYKDVAFSRSSHMRLSTSQVATKCKGVMAYGPLVPNGYGCCYNPRPDDIFFAVSCFKDNEETDANKFRNALERSLLDMHNLLARNQKHKL